MLPELPETVAALDDGQVILCCRALVLLLDRRMAADPASHRPQDLQVSDFHQWVAMGGDGARSLAARLSRASLAEAAAVGRRLMLACRQAAFHQEVRSACRLVMMPVDDLGALSPAIVVAALATVLSWSPACPDREAPRQPFRRRSDPPPEAGRRYPWFHASPESARQCRLEEEK
jgi:hypothetical protein